VIKIADFGKSREGPLDKVSSICGAYYRAPEVVMGKNPFDGDKADVWSATFVLFALYACNRFSG
jgi:serine/threonine protein kinase